MKRELKAESLPSLPEPSHSIARAIPMKRELKVEEKVVNLA